MNKIFFNILLFYNYNYKYFYGKYFSQKQTNSYKLWDLQFYRSRCRLKDIDEHRATLSKHNNEALILYHVWPFICCFVDRPWRLMEPLFYHKILKAQSSQMIEPICCHVVHEVMRASPHIRG